jgi:predicted aldo/keto reductase-like oxidoreductase
MATRRKEVTLSTKLAGRTADQARRQIELSLKRLQTDHLDVLHIHELKSLKDLAAIEAPGGVLEALYQAREQKVAHAIGITCHADPVALQTALERHDFDCTQMALNAGLARMADVPGGFKATLMGAGSFERLALPVATRKKMGVIAMKVFGQEQLLGAAPADKLLTYALPMNLQNTTFVTPCTAARCKEWLFLTTSLGSGAQSASKCRGILSQKRPSQGRPVQFTDALRCLAFSLAR